MFDGPKFGSDSGLLGLRQLDLSQVSLESWRLFVLCILFNLTMHLSKIITFQ